MAPATLLLPILPSFFHPSVRLSFCLSLTACCMPSPVLHAVRLCHVAGGIAPPPHPPATPVPWSGLARGGGARQGLCWPAVTKPTVPGEAGSPPPFPPSGPASCGCCQGAPGPGQANSTHQGSNQTHFCFCFCTSLSSALTPFPSASVSSLSLPTAPAPHGHLSLPSSRPRPHCSLPAFSFPPPCSSWLCLSAFLPMTPFVLPNLCLSASLSLGPSLSSIRCPTPSWPCCLCQPTASLSTLFLSVRLSFPPFPVLPLPPLPSLCVSLSTSVCFSLALPSAACQSLLIPGKSASRFGRRGSAIGIGTVEEVVVRGAAGSGGCLHVLFSARSQDGGHIGDVAPHLPLGRARGCAGWSAGSSGSEASYLGPSLCTPPPKPPLGASGPALALGTLA